ncbi:holdfast anchor protein HfaD [Ponticaulis sp.]|uniref:holdfast anchor protein HfaD n=1 Tax=Ponticaulis sp. TaxID=2020902 RepID=UPI000B67EBEE|nr:holdfast anchor protein HfaD [Ponticaulis sp.]MAI90803.1 hypothetical protein [Ponticaulis sp.]OUX99026.1 MAG: hypothetical protein CBB65_10205 [Hyphomonadaceae bacterium TMED5]
MRDIKVRLMTGSALLALAAMPAFAQEDFPDPAPGADVVVIDQVILGNVLATMDVVIADTAPHAASNATATGNIASGESENNDIDFDATQTQDGTVDAHTTMTGGSVYGGGNGASTITTAYGNSATSSTSNGSTFHYVTQESNAAVSASSTIDLLVVDDVSATTTAAANVSQHTNTYGENRGFQTQTGNADVSAANVVSVDTNTGAAAFGAVATGNSHYASGYTTTSYTGAVQTMADGTRVNAYGEANVAYASNVALSATAAGNSTEVENQWGYATLGRDGSEVSQYNGADIDADTSLTLTNWTGSSGSTSYGVGNSALISNIGSDTGLYAIQNNQGTVQATASFNGGVSDGSVGYASATAIGNAATASLCTVCGQEATVYGSTSQYNDGNVIATGYVNSGLGGYASGAASAIGNSSTYQSTTIGD